MAPGDAHAPPQPSFKDGADGGNVLMSSFGTVMGNTSFIPQVRIHFFLPCFLKNQYGIFTS